MSLRFLLPRHCPQSIFSQRKNGFALIMALGLMALIVLLLLSLAALLQIETMASRSHRDMILARQNALAGAYEALGVLQMELGPDRRVSARADIGDEPNMANPYWVGVWDTSSVSASERFHRQVLGPSPVRWLVSSEKNAESSLSPSIAITAIQRVQLTEAITGQAIPATSSLANPVTAVRVPIKTFDAVQGGYAWWVSDEGVKASIQLSNEQDALVSGDANGLSAEDRLKRRSLFNSRAGLEIVSEPTASAVSDSEELSREDLQMTANMQGPSQLNYLSNNLFLKERADELSHDLTGMACGVLASTLETNGNDTLKVDLSTATAADANGVLGGSAEGVLAYLNSYKTMRKVDLEGAKAPVFPLTLPTPNDASPITGKAYFSVLPVFTEWMLAGCVFAKDLSPLEGDVLWPDPATVKINIEIRTIAWFEMWNPYTTAIDPMADTSQYPYGGHFQLRLKKVPEFRLHYFYDTATNKNNPQWEKNTALDSEGASAWLSYHDIVDSGKNYIGIHLLKPDQTSTTSAYYLGGDMLYWFGLRPASASRNTDANVSHKNDEFISGYGIAKETFYETDRKFTRRYYQSFGAQTSVTWNNSADKNNIRMPIYPIDLSSDTRFQKAKTPFQQHTAFSIEWAPDKTQMEVWWVPNSGASLNSGNRKGNLNNAVHLYSMEMPAPADGYETPPNHYDLKFANYNHQHERFGLHYWREDASESAVDGQGRIKNDWFTASGTRDPRDAEPPDGTFQFYKGRDNPNDHYTEEKTGGETATYPSPDETLTQMLDRRGGLLSGGSNLASTDISEYIMGESGAPDLDSPGNSHPAHRKALFELPTSVPVSLGILQNVHLAGRRPFSIGNSWGRSAGINNANVNVFFDKAYLSALTNSNLSSLEDGPLPNLNLLPIWKEDEAPASVSPDTVLSYFLSKGAFNINSTSKEAWKTILAGGWISDWEYVSLDGSDNKDPWTRSSKKIPLRRSFFHFAHTGDETFFAPDNANEMGEIRGKYYRRGVRRLTNEQIDAVAQTIVGKIKERRAPYSSLAEFLSASVTGDATGPSLLEYALNPTDKEYANPIYDWTAEEMAEDGGETSGSAVGQIDINSPADLTQADILNKLAPVLQARSDTFKIRAYGDVVSASGEVSAKALCELTVQRYPDPIVDPENPASRRNPGTLGRKFKIVSIQWLNAF